MKDNNVLLKDVQQALAKNSALQRYLSKIQVLVNGGAVIIAGVVESSQLKHIAKTIINSVPGVGHLIDNLRIEAIPHHRVSVEINWADGRMALSQ